MKRHWGIALVFAGLGGILLGCGSRSKTQDGSGAEEITRSQLLEDLTPHWAWLDSQMRGLSRPLDWVPEITPQGLNYPRVLQLRSREPGVTRYEGEDLFFVVRDGRADSQVTRVEYEIVRQDYRGRTAHLTGRRDAVYQQGDHRFLIAVLSALGSMDQLSDLDLYVMCVRVHFQGQVRDLRIEFRVSGPLPELLRKNVHALDQGQGEQAVRALSKGEAWVFSETWSNPSSRRMRLNFSLGRPLRWWSMLGRKDFAPSPSSPPRSTYRVEVSETWVRPHSVRVTSSEGGERIVSALGQTEVVVPILPGEELTLVWSVVALPQVEQCTVPSKETHRVDWHETETRPGGLGEGPMETSVRRSGHAVRETQIVGWAVEPPYSTSFRMPVWEDPIRPEKVMVENVMLPGPVSFGMQGSFSAFPCHGVFE